MPHIEFSNVGSVPPSPTDEVVITSFTLAEGFSDVYEKGTTIYDIEFKWDYTGSATSGVIMPMGIAVNPSTKQEHISAANITEDTVFTLSLTGENNTATKTLSVFFVNPIFAGGVVGATPIASEILATDKLIRLPISFVHDFVLEDQRSMIAIPMDSPALTDIQDTIFGLSIINSFSEYEFLSPLDEYGLYRVYIFNAIQNTMGQNQPLNFIW